MQRILSLENSRVPFAFSITLIGYNTKSCIIISPMQNASILLKINKSLLEIWLHAETTYAEQGCFRMMILSRCRNWQ